eukprot:1162024-Pelagomonas_calceolata.AAC.17
MEARTTAVLSLIPALESHALCLLRVHAVVHDLSDAPPIGHSDRLRDMHNMIPDYRHMWYSLSRHSSLLTPPLNYQDFRIWDKYSLSD